MAEYTKQYYSIGEVSRMLDVPIYTLRFWEDSFPMLNPNRTAKGTRRYTPADIDLVSFIKETLYDKGMKIEGAIDHVARFYRRSRPRQLRKCRTPEDAMALLDEVKEILSDSHAIAKIEAVKGWVSSLGFD